MQINGLLKFIICYLFLSVRTKIINENGSAFPPYTLILSPDNLALS